MSIEVMTLVWKHFDRGGSEKLALLALADWCDDSGERLHPSIAAIARKICASESQARRIVHGFIEEGLLDVIGNPAGGAPGASRDYRLRLDRIAATGSKAAGTGARGSAHARGTTDARGRTGARGSTGGRDGSHGCAQTASTGDTLTITETSRTIKKRARVAFDLSGTNELFDEFYAAYPRKVAPDDARKAFAKLKPDRDLLDAMLEAIKAQGLVNKVKRGERQFVPHPATWLNKGRWKDEDPASGASCLFNGMPIIGSAEGRDPCGNGVAL
jgi:hypothetical protein